jgi:hypothetical protein
LRVQEPNDTPSALSNQPDKFSDHQNHKTPVLSGRFSALKPQDTTAISVEIYHPVFAFFKACLQDPPEEELINETFDFMSYMSQLAQKATDPTYEKNSPHQGSSHAAKHQSFHS